MLTRVAGQEYELDRVQVERALKGVDPEPIHEHYVVVKGRRFPPKQVLALVTGLDRADFTTHQARSILRRLGFGAYRHPHSRPTGHTVRPAKPVDVAGPIGPHGGAEAALLRPFAGRWVAQDGLDVMFDADTPGEVLAWLRRHGRRARVWQVPDSPAATGSMLASP